MHGDSRKGAETARHCVMSAHEIGVSSPASCLSLPLLLSHWSDLNLLRVTDDDRNNSCSVFPPADRRGATHVSTCVCSKPTQRRAREETVIRVIRMQATPRDIPSTENDACIATRSMELASSQ